MKYCALFALFFFTTILNAVDFPYNEEDGYLFVTDESVFINTEFLYWTTNEGCLDYAIKMKQTAWGPTPSFANGNYERGTFDWRPGYRLAIGWYNAPKYWETIAEYGWLYDAGSNHVSKPGRADHFLTSTWDTATLPPLSHASSQLQLHYHLANYTFSRVFDPNPHLRLKLIAGLTLAYIKQKWHVRYRNFSENHDDLNQLWRFFGGGFRMGLAADWYMRSGFYLTGKATFATLIGTYKNHTKQTTTQNIDGLNDTTLPIRNGRYADTRFAFHTQFMCGPSYQHLFCDWNFQLFAGYEFNGWFNLQEVFRSSHSAPSSAKETNLATGMLGLNGLSARLSIGF